MLIISYRTFFCSVSTSLIILFIIHNDLVQTNQHSQGQRNEKAFTFLYIHKLFNASKGKKALKTIEIS